MRHNILNILSRGIGEREGHGKKEKAKGQQEEKSVYGITSNEMEGKKRVFRNTFSIQL